MAINTRLVVPGKLDGIGWFTLETVQRITANHPEHQFHLLFDRLPPEDLFPGDNVECHWIWPPARRPFLLDLWFDWAIPRLLKKVGADLFLSPDGFLSARTAVPQVAVQHDLNFEHHPEWLPARIARHYKRRFPDAASRAVRVATVSQFSADDIHSRLRCPTGPHRCGVQWCRGSISPPAAGDQITRSRSASSGTGLRKAGLFSFSSGPSTPRKNLKGLMSAFQQYRKQGGQWDLMLVGTPLWRRRRFDARASLEQLPPAIRNHVHTSGWLPQNELAGILAAAGAMVFIPWFEGFGIPIVEAFAAGTPVIHGNRTSLPEVANGAGIEVDPADTEAVAQAMRRMEDEPGLREALIAKGRDRADDFSWDNTAQLLWSSLTKAGEEAGLSMDPVESERTAG